MYLNSQFSPNRYTFEVAPFFMMVEYAVLAHLRGFLGWLDGDGIFAPGISSISHMYKHL